MLKRNDALEEETLEDYYCDRWQIRENLPIGNEESASKREFWE